jgi:hypothetical protein
MLGQPYLAPRATRRDLDKAPPLSDEALAFVTGDILPRSPYGRTRNRRFGPAVAATPSSASRHDHSLSLPSMKRRLHNSGREYGGRPLMARANWATASST